MTGSGRRGGALLLGLATGAALVGGVATAAPTGLVPASWQAALGSAPATTAAPVATVAAPTRTRLPAATPRPAPVPAVPLPSLVAPPSTTTTTTAPPAPTTTTTEPPSAAPPAASVAAAVTAATNAERRRAGCPEVRPDRRLTAAAQAHASDMAEHGYFAHRGRDGSDFADRIRAQGHPRPGAENLAQGQRSAAEVVAAWMDSPGHRRNILDRKSVV